MTDGTRLPEVKEPVVSLSEDESEMIYRILRASRRDIKSIEIATKGQAPIVRIKMFALRHAEVAYETALKRDDETWKRFFAEHPPMI